MPVTKISISLPPLLAAFVAARDTGNTSAAVGEIISRYAAILTDEEVALVLDAINDTVFSASTLGLLWAAEKWQVEGPALVEKIRAAGIGGQTALVDAAERWWRRVGEGEQPPFGDLLL